MCSSISDSLRARATAFLIAIGTLLQGCYFVYPATSETLRSCTFAGEEGEIVAQLFVENFGLYLFGHFPIFCGDPDGPAWFPVTFFRDRVNDEELARCFAREVARYGDDVKVVGVSQVNSDTVAFDAPGFDVPVVVPYLICFRDNQICGTIVRKTPKREGGAE